MEDKGTLCLCFINCIQVLNIIHLDILTSYVSACVVVNLFLKHLPITKQALITCHKTVNTNTAVHIGQRVVTIEVMFSCKRAVVIDNIIMCCVLVMRYNINHRSHL